MSSFYINWYEQTLKPNYSWFRSCYCPFLRGRRRRYEYETFEISQIRIRNSKRFFRNDYDLSPYLHRYEKQTPVDVTRAPIESITFIRKTLSPTRVEPRLPDIHDTSCVDLSMSRKNAQNIKPATYDWTTLWLDFKSHFEACASVG